MWTGIHRGATPTMDIIADSGITECDLGTGCTLNQGMVTPFFQAYEGMRGMSAGDWMPRVLWRHWSHTFRRTRDQVSGMMLCLFLRDRQRNGHVMLRKRFDLQEFLYRNFEMSMRDIFLKARSWAFFMPTEVSLRHFGKKVEAVFVGVEGYQNRSFIPRIPVASQFCMEPASAD